jgi:hypothetical protein
MTVITAGMATRFEAMDGMPPARPAIEAIRPWGNQAEVVTRAVVVVAGTDECWRKPKREN